MKLQQNDLANVLRRSVETAAMSRHLRSDVNSKKSLRRVCNELGCRWSNCRTNWRPNRVIDAHLSLGANPAKFNLLENKH